MLWELMFEVTWNLFSGFKPYKIAVETTKKLLKHLFKKKVLAVL